MSPKIKVKPSTKENSAPRGWRRVALILSAALIIPVILWMYIESRVVHLVKTEVRLRDLPPEFDGMTVLFVSDLHMAFYSSPESTLDLMRQLMMAQPDLLLMGGDYTHETPFDEPAQELARREAFFKGMQTFAPPMGKYAVPGNHDESLDNALSVKLEDAAAAGGVTLLRNQVVRLQKDGASIALVGLDDWTKGVRDPIGLAEQVRSDECAIVLSHNPDALPRMNNQPSADRGLWVDLMLSGHTHGGQVTLFGFRTLYNPSIYGDRFLSGWAQEQGAKLLTSHGVGSVMLPIRLCAPAQAHLLTLRRGE